MTLMGLRLNLLVTDLSKQFGIYLVVFALTFFIPGRMESGVSGDSN